MSGLPEGVEPYARSPSFTKSTVPQKLLAVHDLKVGAWGRLNVVAGTVTYFIVGQNEGRDIEEGNVHIIPPQEQHYISLSQDAEFFIEFCAIKKT